MFEILDITGVVAFAISGALVAIGKRFDPFGVFIVAFATSVGGGTLRDVLINRPVFWIENVHYFYPIFIGVLLAILFRKKLKLLSKSLFLFDTIGLGLYTIVGTEIGILNNLHPIICISLGTISAAFGGVTRDILCSKIPIIFKKEIYATASIIGSIVFLTLSHYKIDETISYILTSAIVIAIRLIAVRLKMQLPTFYTTTV
ncbi:trimeric intracellular cation channel family protein [Lutibacter sp. TH_r2]|uniref:trimeric intracellular cation channel family protein n=1 Tax=Lutibacter sp. TH_r2 TaxID=3082083 RepID=UPI0029547329|nr:trimeric intracellular cation channel family protein [Lutibacter sp. TH_r2]MDV7188144.1 trimeric intracellular cation channel family protein [Lutibacter sp. TH_r2]